MSEAAENPQAVYCPSGHENPGHLNFCEQCDARIYATPAMIQWAHYYNAYKRLAGGGSQLAELLQPLRETLAQSGQIPDWAGVDLLRGWAFLLARMDNRDGGDGRALGAEFVAVVDAIDRHPAAFPRERSPLDRTVTAPQPAEVEVRAAPIAWNPPRLASP